MTEETMNGLIQSLLDALADGQRHGVRLSPEIQGDYHAALTALLSRRASMDRIAELEQERDEARRLYCEEWAFTIELERGEAGDPRDLANEKKWDCYKENNNE